MSAGKIVATYPGYVPTTAVRAAGASLPGVAGCAAGAHAPHPTRGATAKVAMAWSSRTAVSSLALLLPATAYAMDVEVVAEAADAKCAILDPRESNVWKDRTTARTAPTGGSSRTRSGSQNGARLARHALFHTRGRQSVPFCHSAPQGECGIRQGHVPSGDPPPAHVRR
eukprot:2147019-Prymnesium_polylepis.1